MVGLAVDDLKSNYVFPEEEYSVEPMFETPDQERGRKEIIRGRKVALKGWPATAKHKANILTLSPYAIWSLDIAVSRVGSIVYH